jgi:hypothetical protein
MKNLNGTFRSISNNYRKPWLKFLVYAMFPEVEDDQNDELPYEHPMIAVGIALLSAACLGAVETKLIEFTGYSSWFIVGISVNMRNNGLWVRERYDSSEWLSQDGKINTTELWSHIEMACGVLWKPQADGDISEDVCGIYWDEHGWFGGFDDFQI